MRIAGAQIPVGPNIQSNKREILKALDWAKQNRVDHLLTPEGALSGYCDGWQEKDEEISSALKEIEQCQHGVGLHLGVLTKEKESIGLIHRNQIRHYDKSSKLNTITRKTYCIPQDRCLGRLNDDPVRYFELESGVWAIGMICNDMWGAAEELGIAFCERHLVDRGLSVIFHATNGMKWNKNDKRNDVFSSYSEGFLRMTAFKSQSNLITVDSCVPWNWNGDESLINESITSSPSGVLNFMGWQTNVPRQGRQYFYCDIELNTAQEYKNYDGRMSDEYPYVKLLR